MEKSKKKRIGCLVVAAVLAVALGIFFFGSQKASWYTEEQHAERIAKRIEKNYMTDESEYTSFELYPLYNLDDKLEFFLVEFEPSGFMYVKIREENNFSSNVFWGTRGLYSQCIPQQKWSRYRIDETNGQPYPEEDKEYFEKDENGEKIVYNKSPYAVAGALGNTKGYLLKLKDVSGNWVYVAAKKQNDKFINLVSMTEFFIENNKLTEKQAVTSATFVAKRRFDLI